MGLQSFSCILNGSALKVFIMFQKPELILCFRGDYHTACVFCSGARHRSDTARLLISGALCSRCFLGKAAGSGTVGQTFFGSLNVPEFRNVKDISYIPIRCCNVDCYQLECAVRV